MVFFRNLEISVLSFLNLALKYAGEAINIYDMCNNIIYISYRKDICLVCTYQSSPHTSYAHVISMAAPHTVMSLLCVAVTVVTVQV